MPVNEDLCVGSLKSISLHFHVLLRTRSFAQFISPLDGPYAETSSIIQDWRSLSSQSSSSTSLIFKTVTFQLLQHHVNFSPPLPQPLLSLQVLHLDTIVQLH